MSVPDFMAMDSIGGRMEGEVVTRCAKSHNFLRVVN